MGEKADRLRYVRKGEPVTAQQHNLMVGALKARDLPASSYQDASGTVTRSPPSQATEATNPIIRVVLNDSDLIGDGAYGWATITFDAGVAPTPAGADGDDFSVNDASGEITFNTSGTYEIRVVLGFGTNAWQAVPVDEVWLQLVLDSIAVVSSDYPSHCHTNCDLDADLESPGQVTLQDVIEITAGSVLKIQGRSSYNLATVAGGSVIARKC